MRYFTVILGLLVVLSSHAQKSGSLAVKTYSPEEWNKWYFNESDLRTVETDNWNNWMTEMWGIPMKIHTQEKGIWNSWAIKGTESSCSTDKKKKYDSWTVTLRDTTISIKATSKDLSIWEIGNILTARINEKDDWGHWIIEGDLSGGGHAEIVVYSFFIPIFSAVIRKQYKLK